MLLLQLCFDIYSVLNYNKLIYDMCNSCTWPDLTTYSD